MEKVPQWPLGFQSNDAICCKIAILSHLSMLPEMIRHWRISVVVVAGNSIEALLGGHSCSEAGLLPK